MGIRQSSTSLLAQLHYCASSAPTSLIAANKRDYLPDKQLHARQLPKDARRDNFGTGVIHTEEDGQCKTIDTAQNHCVDCPHVRAIRRVCVGITPAIYLR